MEGVKVGGNGMAPASSAGGGVRGTSSMVVDDSPNTGRVSSSSLEFLAFFLVGEATLFFSGDMPNE